ncbi:UNVERIFIED_CONTAM: hypothetical protein PYX00_007463 [Menopon gallinae]|uniref:Phospholipid/glycerol acyltransferase domain-containing protein n=1 Tax=Menopon gallinae TaxID=328185 RepID=A0AAW2HKA1_9NEOP
MTLNERGMNNFQDILKDRRTTNDFLWASRAWDPVLAYIQPKKSSPEQIKSITLYNLFHVIYKLSGIYEENAALHQVVEILEQIEYNKVMAILRWLAFIIAKILKRCYSEVLINEGKFLQIKSQMGRNPVLFVPTHRSYGDFIMMSYICFHFEIDIPRIAAGMDFHSMAVVGKILRDSCAFFMRRSFTTDRLYATVFSQYVQTLVTNGDASIEFFIEGTRSRTAKSLVPKYGFLSMTLKPFLTGMVPDITILPVNLSYDRVLEEVLFVYELLGVPKPKESTKGLFKALTILNESYGNIYINFGEPLSVRNYFGSNIDRSIHNFGPVHMQELTSDESKQISQLAHNIVRKQQDLTVINCFNLVSTVINNHVMGCSMPLTLDGLIFEVEWLLPIIKGLNAIVAVEKNVVHSINVALQLHSNLVRVTTDKNIKLLIIHSKTGQIDQGKFKGHTLSNKTMDIAVPLLLIQYYSNPCAHFLVNLAFILLVVECVKNGSISLDDLYSYYKFLRSVFSNEFVFNVDTEEEDFKTALEFAINHRAISQSGADITADENKKLRQFCRNFFKCYIPSYMILVDVLLKRSESFLSQRTIQKTYQEAVESLISRGYPIHPACLSLDLVTNALNAFAQMSAVRKVRRESQTQYVIHHEELRKICDQLKLFDYTHETEVEVTEHLSIFLNGKL